MYNTILYGSSIKSSSKQIQSYFTEYYFYRLFYEQRTTNELIRKKHGTYQVYYV